MNEETKYCKFCGKEKPIKDFVKSGFCVRNICKDCNNKKQKEVYKNSKNYHKLQQENQQLKENNQAMQEELARVWAKLDKKEEIINKAKEYNKQIIKDTKDFYRPTSDKIYSGDCLIDLAKENLKILNNKRE